ncbi:hypothetical protein QVD17_40044 [Tagetes erecta]|uniref:Uncharacterized protein n=1 Tax=Tagetes erecta TaxID=13708 RepID=A0AAD8JRK2_TARER|nr:hypothetical protein QVD17_40044 [Tagetes erecta]
MSFSHLLWNLKEESIETALFNTTSLCHLDWCRLFALELRNQSILVLSDLWQCLPDTHNQADITHGGGIVPLLKLLDSRNGTLTHNGGFALWSADNEDKVAKFLRVGSVRNQIDGAFVLQCLVLRMEQRTRLLYFD